MTVSGYGEEGNSSRFRRGRPNTVNGRRVNSRTRRMRAVVSTTLLAADVAVFIMAVGDFHGPVRLALGLVLGAVITGWSVIGLLNLGDMALEIGLTVAVSLALLMVIAQIMLTLDAWHPVALQEAICVICGPSLIWQSLDLIRTGTTFK